jgi:hypothetical protein
MRSSKKSGYRRSARADRRRVYAQRKDGNGACRPAQRKGVDSDHIKTPRVHFNIEGLEPLLAENATRRVHHLNANTATLSRETLGDRRLLILDYKRS